MSILNPIFAENGLFHSDFWPKGLKEAIWLNFEGILAKKSFYLSECLAESKKLIFS